MAMNFDAIVIGTGFGGTIAATKLAAKGKKVLMLERGTWWVTPAKLGKTPPSPRPSIPAWAKTQQPPQPVQYWTRPDNKDGMHDFFAAIRSGLNKDGLYQYSIFKQADILTASGVGGGSLIYSNVTLRAQPEVLFGIGLNLGDAEYQAAYKWMEDFRGKLNHIVTKIPLPGRDVTNLTTDDYLYLDRARVLRDAAKLSAEKLGVQLPWAPLIFRSSSMIRTAPMAAMRRRSERSASARAVASWAVCHPRATPSARRSTRSSSQTRPKE